MSVYTLPQLFTVSLLMFIAEFENVEGKFLRQVGLDEDSETIHTLSIATEAKPDGRQYCLAGNLYNERFIYKILMIYGRVVHKMRRKNCNTRYVGLTLRGTVDIGGHLLFNDYTSSGKIICNSCMKVLNKHLMIYETLQHAQFERSFNKNKRLHIPVISLELVYGHLTWQITMF